MPGSNFCADCHGEFLEKFGWKRIITVEGVAFWNFHPIGAHVKRKKSFNFKTPNFLKRKQGLEVWWIATFPQKYGINLLDGFWENVFYGPTTGGRTTDARATALVLLTQSSRVNNSVSEWLADCMTHSLTLACLLTHPFTHSLDHSRTQQPTNYIKFGPPRSIYLIWKFYLIWKSKQLSLKSCIATIFKGTAQVSDVKLILTPMRTHGILDIPNTHQVCLAAILVAVCDLKLERDQRK